MHRFRLKGISKILVSLRGKWPVKIGAWRLVTLRLSGNCIIASVGPSRSFLRRIRGRRKKRRIFIILWAMCLIRGIFMNLMDFSLVPFWSASMRARRIGWPWPSRRSSKGLRSTVRRRSASTWWWFVRTSNSRTKERSSNCAYPSLLSPSDARPSSRSTRKMRSQPTLKPLRTNRPQLRTCKARSLS